MTTTTVTAHAKNSAGRIATAAAVWLLVALFANQVGTRAYEIALDYYKRAYIIRILNDRLQSTRLIGRVTLVKDVRASTCAGLKGQGGRFFFRNLRRTQHIFAPTRDLRELFFPILSQKHVRNRLPKNSKRYQQWRDVNKPDG